MKRASASIYKDKIYYVASGKTESWLWVTIEPVLSSSRKESSSVLGEFVRNILDSSKVDIPDPDPKTYQNPVVKAAGAKSWFGFAKEATSVFLFEENGTVEILPSKWAGRKEGVIVLDDKPILASSDNPNELGQALRKAFDLCE